MNTDNTSDSQTSIQSLDIHKLLQLLNTANETEVQVKLFTILAAYLVSNCNQKETIIKCDTVYDKVNCILNKCLPLKTTSTLDFVTALVYSDEEMESLSRRHSLAMYAKNRVRVSGCLSTMATLFSSGMLYQDTWKSLCRSLAETCNGSELNQSYCSHLVPLCIQKCKIGSMDVYLILQSLLRDHERNIQLFLDCEGVTTFTREQLQNDMCMQLLVTLVQSSHKAAFDLRESRIFDNLQDLIQTYGKHSKTGQWAHIVMYYIESHSKGNNNHTLHDSKRQKITKSFTDIANNKKAKDNNNKTGQGIFFNSNYSSNPIQKLDDNKLMEFKPNKEDDTGELLQNIVKELIHSKDNFGYLQSAISNIRSQAINLCTESKCMPMRKSLQTANTKTNMHVESPKVDLNITRKLRTDTYKQKYDTRKASQTTQVNSDIFAKYNNAKETKTNMSTNKFMESLSFTFLLQDSKYGKKSHEMSTYHTMRTHNLQTNITNKLKMLNTNTSNNSHKSIYSNYLRPYNENYGAQVMNKSAESIEFRPISVSTPKNRKGSITEMYNQTFYSKYNSISQFSVNQYKRTSEIKDRRVRKQKRSKRPKPLKVKELTRRSMSSRFFNAINDSCTTLVKTVKNIFVAKKDVSVDEESANSISANDNSDVKTCSYSFTNYMRKRDAVLLNENSSLQELSIQINDNACKTCNDTSILQHKLVDDDHLKKTIKKLKLGINLYGCDFKKISKNFWPRETYMTPAVLYNLYRKLIAK